MKKITLFRPYVPESAIEAVVNVLRMKDSPYVGQGPVVDEFERKFSARVGGRACVATSSCTSALHLAYLLAGIEPDSTVIAPLFTCTAGNIALLHCRAKIQFCDVAPGSLNMDPEHVASLITERTKAVVIVDYGGMPTDIRSIADVSWHDRQIPIIEDCAQSLGATRSKEWPVGTEADYACFSFQAVKHVTCFPPETRIVMPREGRNGICKRIDEIRPGDLVLTFDHESSEKTYQRVIHAIKTPYHGKMLVLSLSNGNDLKITPDHPVFDVDRNGYFRADELRAGSRLLQYKYYGLHMRCRGKQLKGKTYEEHFGEDVGKRLRGTLSRIRSGALHPRYGEQVSDETRAKMSASSKGKPTSDDTRALQSASQKARRQRMTKEELANQLNGLERERSIPGFRQRQSERATRGLARPEVREKISVGVRRAMGKDSYWKNYHEGVNRKQNQAELKLGKLLNEWFPNEWGYNGNFSLGVSLDRQIPDFVNINGKKKVIELFGHHWHSEKIRGKSGDEQIAEKVERYGTVGFGCLAIWESELSDPNTLHDRLKNYLLNPNTEIVSVVDIKEIDYDGEVFNLETESHHNYFAYGILVHNCGDGGMLVLPVAQAAEAKRRRWFGIDRQAKLAGTWANDITELGFKSQMTDIAASMGIAGLDTLDWQIAHRRALRDTYARGLAGIDGIQMLDTDPESACWLCTVLVDRREDFRRKLASEDIESDQVHYRNDRYSIFKDFRGEFPNMDAVDGRYLCLPLHAHLTIEDVERICAVARSGW